MSQQPLIGIAACICRLNSRGDAAGEVRKEILTRQEMTEEAIGDLRFLSV